MTSPATAAAPTDACRLYFAVYPDAATAAAVAALAEAARARLGLRGRAVPVHRLHVTVAYLGSFDALRPDLVDAAGVAAERIEREAVPVEFDTLASFDSRRRTYPLVLRGGDNAALHGLQQRLSASLVATRAIASPAPYEPHLTLLYDRTLVAAEAVAPVRFTAHELVLVAKRTGAEHDDLLKRWPLPARQEHARDVR